VLLVATLISRPDRPAVTDALLAEARRAARSTALPVRLDGEAAAEFAVKADGRPDKELAKQLAASLRSGLGDAPVDISVQPATGRRKRLFLADMDSTMIEQECIDELADFVGLKAEVSAITERAMRGEIAFEPALRERVALLKGLAVGVVDEIIRERIRQTPGGRTLLATLRANGARTCLVSGGFTLFTGPIAAALGFDEHRANRLALDGSKLAGAMEEPILGREAKRATLIELRGRWGLEASETLAVGDGANDLLMLGEAGLGVAFRAKPAVAAEADVRIDHGDLTALLFIQGYRRDEFVGAANP
jgi:phosphoserine phosphatase